MKNLIKIIITLTFLLIFVVVCFISFAGLSFGAWLHTYRTFTQKDLVAVIEVEGLQISEDGYEYTNVKYKPIKDSSALTKIFSSREAKEGEYTQEQEFKIYGDQIEVGGEFVKFNDYWNLFNLKNIYKVTRLEGDYSDAEKASNLPTGKRTVIALNGGTDDTWKFLQKRADDFGFLVDSVYGNFSTKFIQEEDQEYGLYVTEDGFILDDLEE